VYEAGDTLRRLLDGKIDRIGLSGTTLIVNDPVGKPQVPTAFPPRICDGLGFLGIELNETRNAKSALLISQDAGRVAVRVIRTDEQLMIARSVCRALKLGIASEKQI
jgi:hypothetical protein